MVVNPHQVARAVGRAERGVTISESEAVALLGARGEELDRLVGVAGRLRDQGLISAGRPGVVTYSPKVFIPLTRLCRDRCSYCTFATDPASLRKEGGDLYLSRDEVVDLALRGAELGCAEALFTLGDAPEDRWPAAAQWLEEAGYDDTMSYVRASSVAVLEEAGLLPHLNPGVMTWAQLQRLRPVAPSMGMMLETTSRRLYETRGEVHHGSPDKDPAVRLRVLEDAGRLSIPFTTGLLIGIGETDAELADSIFQLRRIGREYGHLQEVLIQNFRAKPGTASANRPDADESAYLAALATTRVVLGPGVRIQAPPNLSSEAQLLGMLAAGVDDFGGISPLTPDHVNPERPWPQIDRLRPLVEAAHLELHPRLTVHPPYVQDPRWIDPRLVDHVAALSDSGGLLKLDASAQGRQWQEEDPGYAEFASRHSGGRVDLGETIDIRGRSSEARGDIQSVYGDWEEIKNRAARGTTQGVTAGPSRLAGDLKQGLDLALANPAALADARHLDSAVALMKADGEPLEALCEIADQHRRDAAGDDVTYVVNRNLNFTNVCYTGCRFCAFAQRAGDADAFTLSLDEVGERVDEAVALGATEICMQGGIHPELTGESYFDLVRTVKLRQPGVHLHAFSPMEVVNGAAKADISIEDWLRRARDEGLDSIPGTAAEILDDEVRWVLTKGKLPTDAWVDVVRTAHRLGIRSSSTMMYGHVDRPDHWVAHLSLLRGIQEETGGFTEFVPLPFVHQQAPLYLAGVARPGPSVRDDRAVHAMARVMLHGAIHNVQTSWVKLGRDGCVVMLAGGANDLGGTLMEETISRMAGSTHGSSVAESELINIATAAGRPAKQRITVYA